MYGGGVSTTRAGKPEHGVGGLCGEDMEVGRAETQVFAGSHSACWSSRQRVPQSLMAVPPLIALELVQRRAQLEVLATAFTFIFLSFF